MADQNTEYDFLNTAEKVCEGTVDGLRRDPEHNKQTIGLRYRFELRHCNFKKNGDDVGPEFVFDITYRIPAGSSYIEVKWREDKRVHNGKFYEWKHSDWVQVAYHDSCWRGSWGDIFRKAREVLSDKFKVKSFDSWYFNCESFKLYNETNISEIDK
jgi:hypothetical protein